MTGCMLVHLSLNVNVRLPKEMVVKFLHDAYCKSTLLFADRGWDLRVMVIKPHSDGHINPHSDGHIRMRLTSF